MRWIHAFFVLILWLSMPISWASAADAEPDCSNPRSAADSLFIFQRAESWDLKKAGACMDVADPADAERTAVQLRQVLDAKGIWVPVSGMPDDPEHAEDGEHIHVPMPDLFPQMVLIRADDGRWLYSRDTVEAVAGMYTDTFSTLSQWFQSQLPAVFYTRILGVYGWQMLYAALLVLLAWIVGQLLRLLLRSQVLRWLKRAGISLDEVAYAHTNGPIVAMVTVGVVYLGLADLQLPIKFSGGLHFVLWGMIWVALLVTMYRFIYVAEVIARSWTAATESKLDDQLIPLLRQAAQLGLIVIGGLYLVDELGFDVWKLAAGVGIGGLAFALAAQDTVANVFGSLNIFVDKPFQIGDAVSVGGVDGVVEEVGFRSTRVRTYYNSLVTIPNSKITNANVDNWGLRHQRRQRFILGLTYNSTPDQLEAFVAGVHAMLAEVDEVQPGYQVRVNDLGASSIDILVQYHLVVPGWDDELAMRAEHILNFMRLAEKNGVSFAFPSTSVYVESMPGESS